MSRISFSAVYKALLCLVLLVCLAIFAVRTWHWPLVGDAPTIHYAVFLLEHGEAPYRQVVDVNMPGAYLVEWLAMHLLGGGSLAWRIFDLLEGAAAAAAMIAIAWPYDRFAGFLAGSLFILLHGHDGLRELGQRDLSVAALLLIAYALAFHALRHPRGRLWTMALFGLFLGLATAVKLTPILLAPPLLALLGLDLQRRREPWRRPLAAACAGFVLPLLATLIFLLRERAVGAFFTVLFRLIPIHAHLHRLSAGELLLHALAANLLPMALLWLPVALFAGLRRNTEWLALLLGLLFGIASFCVQGKGYAYQRYPAEAFLLLLMAVDLCVAFSHPAVAGRERPPTALSRSMRPFAAAALAALVVAVGIGSTRKAIHFDWRNHEFDSMLRADLTQLGGPALNGQVQCMDMAAGCLGSLYSMRLVQDTGFLYDCYLLDPGPHYGYRRRFLHAVESRPPAVFIVTGNPCNEPGTHRPYQQLRAWPQFDGWFASHYFLYAQEVPPHLIHWEGRPGPHAGFRIYVRDGFRTVAAAGPRFPPSRTESRNRGGRVFVTSGSRRWRISVAWFYEWFFPAVWIAFMLYWQVAAANVKTTERIEPVLSRILRSLPFVVAILLLMLDRLPLPWLYRHFMPSSRASFLTGAAITVAGLLFAVWARRHIGANWSRSVTIKQQHELITTGPYAFVRHPIYTGILTGFLGTAVAVTQYRGIVALLLVFLSLWYKLRLEERWMRAQFGPAYTDYAARTAALVPGLL